MMKLNDILKNDNNRLQNNNYQLETYTTQYITFSNLYLYYNDDEFLELLFNSINEGKCEIETNLNEIGHSQLDDDIRYDRLSRAIKFIISINCDDKYLIISNIAEDARNNTYLTTKILNVIIEAFNEQLKDEDNQEEEQNLNLNELSTYISKIHTVDNNLLTNVKLKNGETVFCDNDNVYNLNSEEISLSQININDEQNNDDHFLIDPSELNEEDYQRFNEEGSPDDEDDTENNDENDNTNNLEELKNRLTDHQFEQIEILINLLNQELNYNNVLSHASDLNYI